MKYCIQLQGANINVELWFQGKKSTTVMSAANTSIEAGVKPSSASSFFGAMATDWFG